MRVNNLHQVVVSDISCRRHSRQSCYSPPSRDDTPSADIDGARQAALPGTVTDDGGRMGDRRPIITCHFGYAALRRTLIWAVQLVTTMAMGSITNC